MGTSFIPFSAIIAVLIIAFLFASLPQVNHKTRYRVLYAIAIIMLLLNEYILSLSLQDFQVCLEKGIPFLSI